MQSSDMHHRKSFDVLVFSCCTLFGEPILTDYMLMYVSYMSIYRLVYCYLFILNNTSSLKPRLLLHTNTYIVIYSVYIRLLLPNHAFFYIPTRILLFIHFTLDFFSQSTPFSPYQHVYC